MIQRNLSIVLSACILFLVGTGVYFNILEQKAVDQSKIPEKVEESTGFQRWITNLKNNDFVIEADEFRLVEENEIYNTKWMTVKSIDQDGVEEEYQAELAAKIALSDIENVIFSPNERQYVDYRASARDLNPNEGRPYQPNEIHYYGLREDKVVDARILDCSIDANCYFDRAYFLPDSNDTFVVSEFSLTLGEDAAAQTCEINELCEYTIKVHVIDLLQNSRLIYESEPFEVNLGEIAHEL